MSCIVQLKRNLCKNKLHKCLGVRFILKHHVLQVPILSSDKLDIPLSDVHKQLVYTLRSLRFITFDKLIIDLDSYELIVDGKKIDTPPKELELLYHLAATPNRVYTRNQLLDEVWGFDYFGDSRTVDVHVKRLREKVENVSDQWALKTVWGVGYKFEVK